MRPTANICCWKGQTKFGARTNTLSSTDTSICFNPLPKKNTKKTQISSSISFLLKPGGNQKKYQKKTKHHATGRPRKTRKATAERKLLRLGLCESLELDQVLMDGRPYGSENFWNGGGGPGSWLEKSDPCKKISMFCLASGKHTCSVVYLSRGAESPNQTRGKKDWGMDLPENVASRVCPGLWEMESTNL